MKSKKTNFKTETKTRILWLKINHFQYERKTLVIDSIALGISGAAERQRQEEPHK